MTSTDAQLKATSARRDLSLRVLRAIGVNVTRDDQDRMVWLTSLVAVGLVTAAAFAIFGLPNIPLPMPTWAFGVVTPTCGLTRASTALARGEIGTAWAFNPAAFVLAAVAVVTGIRWLRGRFTGTWINVSLKPTRLGWACIVVLVILWWINQQLHATLIMTGTV